MHVVTDTVDPVIDVFDKTADCIERVMEDPEAADVVRRAVRLYVQEGTISFQDALLALFGKAETHRERADITRAGELLRDIADRLGERRR